MTTIITMAALKGGAGKSTLAIHLAAYLHEEFGSTVILDMDPQGSALDWGKRREELGEEGPSVVKVPAAKHLAGQLKAIEGRAEVAVIDTPPRLSSREALSYAHLVVMPTVPGVMDLWSLESVEGAWGKGFEPILVINRMNRSKLARGARMHLKENGARVAKTTLGDRVAFGEAIAAGQGVTAYAPKSKAAKEIKALAQELSAVLSEGTDGE